MFFRRLRNLWKLSDVVEVTFDKKGDPILHVYNEKNFVSKKNPQKRMATILEDDPKEMFEEHNENV